jgi:hypothetical protein
LEDNDRAVKGCFNKAISNVDELHWVFQNGNDVLPLLIVRILIVTGYMILRVFVSPPPPPSSGTDTPALQSHSHTPGDISEKALIVIKLGESPELTNHGKASFQFVFKKCKALLAAKRTYRDMVADVPGMATNLTITTLLNCLFQKATIIHTTSPFSNKLATHH